MSSQPAFRCATLLVSVLALTWACGDDDEDGGTGPERPEQTGAACTAPIECYPGVEDPTLIEGNVQCLDRVDDGYCTHTCETDDNCCSIPGECEAGTAQVCAPFESSDTRMCFLSCEAGAIGDQEEQAFCHEHASPEFICRSSGGGDPRKVCVPGDCDVGESCASDTDCATGLTCILALRGGYCSVRDCVNADCPNGSTCVDRGDGLTLCMRTCATDGDCGFCRAADVIGTCDADVVFVETGTTGSVCVPPA